ncbi:MAG TPA: Kdo hydroxylase family protein [Methylotenera sp.]|nr:Kdo hydroxylase family protein [Methylotenera sp.]
MPEFQNPILTLPYDSFTTKVSAVDQERYIKHLEHGGILFLPKLGFDLAETEMRFLSPEWSDGKAKNIYLRGYERKIRGAKGDEADLEAMSALIERYALNAKQLISNLLPAYAQHAKPANTSIRCIEAAGRKTSWRKDDSRLHADAFPSKPTHGERILRVFTNVNPYGKPRVWKVGEPFADMARKFIPKIPRYSKTQAKLLYMLGITKSVRGEYDHAMLHLHDLAKADIEYQKTAPQMQFEFPASSTWIVYSDQVLHAVLSGQHMMEQTLHLAPQHLHFPEASPKEILKAF